MGIKLARHTETMRCHAKYDDQDIGYDNVQYLVLG